MLAALKKNKFFRQFLTSRVDRCPDNEKNEDLTDQHIDMAAHIIYFSLGDGSPSASLLNANIARIDSDDSPIRFLATLSLSITAHSLIARIYDKDKYSADKHSDILINTGCSRSSSAGLD